LYSTKNKNNEKVFSAGSDNFIAGWNFNEKAIFSGIQTNSGSYFRLYPM